MSRVAASDSYIVKASSEVISTTSYARIIATDGTCKVNFIATYVLIVDKTSIQANREVYLDTLSFTGTNGAPNAFSLPNYNPTTMYAALTAFNFLGTTPAKFSFDPSTLTLTSTGYNFINISIVSYRFRKC